MTSLISIVLVSCVLNQIVCTIKSLLAALHWTWISQRADVYFPNVADEGRFPFESASVATAVPLALELQIVGVVRGRTME